ncbi:hypothetical protein SJAG_04662 [Schizosaccharomyces japonicus yFS275]|uniref:UBX domain-containing protein n=1 Tax=Schizosaccharomyces japonicus (strain yFS275 / FY16936) TaxID=402676 RepID=B6K7F3_SCHJY|nr:hypothetical protein SJAG_04662 [Schizosaccharomyces japonicus yFS275]EEB09457.1 hypothetical protein SJAG_04662 [Schizosaccharomyces japonicus yFS275]
MHLQTIKSVEELFALSVPDDNAVLLILYTADSWYCLQQLLEKHRVTWDENIKITLAKFPLTSEEAILCQQQYSLKPSPCACLIDKSEVKKTVYFPPDSAGFLKLLRRLGAGFHSKKQNIPKEFSASTEKTVEYVAETRSPTELPKRRVSVDVARLETQMQPDKDACYLNIRLRSGKSLKVYFSSDSTLVDVRAWLYSQGQGKDYEFEHSFPYRLLTESDNTKTLRELGFSPSATLYLKQTQIPSQKRSALRYVKYLLPPLFAVYIYRGMYK